MPITLFAATPLATLECDTAGRVSCHARNHVLFAPRRRAQGHSDGRVSASHSSHFDYTEAAAINGELRSFHYLQSIPRCLVKPAALKLTQYAHNPLPLHPHPQL